MGARFDEEVPDYYEWEPSMAELEAVQVQVDSGRRRPEPQAEEDPHSFVTKLMPGGSFLLDGSSAVVSVWGDGDRCLWSEGEGLMICGGQGVGKTTLGQQVALGRIGLRKEVLGLPVKVGRGRLLYIAGDRPRQARRSMARMVTENDRKVLDERLVFWKGPLPADVVSDPTVLVRMAQEAGADTIVIDSLKDVAPKLSDDATGSAVNTAFQLCIAADIEVLVLHHQRKAGSGIGTGEPSSLSDVYGSTWITSGLGSIVYLGGKPGDLVVRLKHLKQPAEIVGPLAVVHDHTLGSSSVRDEVNPLDLLRQSLDGLTAQALAAALGDKLGDRNGVEKSRRILEGLVKRGVAESHEGVAVGGGRAPKVYMALEIDETAAPHLPSPFGARSAAEEIF